MSTPPSSPSPGQFGSGGLPGDGGGSAGWGQPGGAQPAGWGQPGPAGGPQPGGWGGAPAPATGTATAPWGLRLVASIVDGLVVYIPVFVVTFILGLIVGGIAASSPSTTIDPETGQLTGSASGAIVALQFISAFIIVAATAAYYGFLYPRNHGQSLGKKLLGIRVRRLDGRPWTFGGAAVREALVKGLLIPAVFLVGFYGGIIALALVGFVLALVNYLWPLWDADNEALHDKIVKTRVDRA